MQLAFIGVGTMGGPMARHLSEAGHDLAVYDVSDEAVERAGGWGATVAESPAATVDGAEVVFLSLPGPDEVDAVVEASDGIADALEPGMIVVDTTTTLPNRTDQIEARLAERDVPLLGAPVSGGPSGAEGGTLSTMVGGPRDAFDEVEPLLEVVASDVFYVGERPAQGHAMKLVNNLTSFAGFLAACEATILGQKVGLGMETMLDVMNASSGRNSATDHKFPEYVLPGTFDMGAPLSLMEKDILLATRFGENEGAPLAFTEQTCQLIGYARSYCGDDADYTQVYQFFEAMMMRE